ncbi:MAG: multidrug effflux MFS transporter [Gammaproteobacteria bacterium]|nr:multidrug effflux MFS transporter [Gammaproteobacteria bacterium]
MSQPAATPALRTGEFVPLIALLISLVALAIDAMLPALPAIGEDLGVVHRNDVQFVITAVFLGMSMGQIVFGPLSDRIGRKPAIHAGLVLFMAGCLMSIYARSFEVMIAGRVLQGIGVSAPRVVVMALVRDQYAGRQMARIMSFAMGVFIIVPTIAPALGQWIQFLSGWRAIFAVFFAVAAVGFLWFAIRQPETLPSERRRSLSPRAIGRTAVEVVKIRIALGYTLASGCVFAPFLAYLSASQQIFQDVYDTGALFPFYFGVLALAVGVATFVNGRLVMQYGMRKLSRGAMSLATIGSVVGLGLTFVFDGVLPFWLFMAYLLFVFVCVGLLFGNLGALAMQPLGHIAGVGAAVVASLSTLVSVPLGALVAYIFDGTLYALIAAYVVFGFGALAAMKWADGGWMPRRRRAPLKAGADL